MRSESREHERANRLGRSEARACERLGKANGEERAVSEVWLIAVTRAGRSASQPRAIRSPLHHIQKPQNTQTIGSVEILSDFQVQTVV